jgi:hypothetical protein
MLYDCRLLLLEVLLLARLLLLSLKDVYNDSHPQLASAISITKVASCTDGLSAGTDISSTKFLPY